MKRFLKQIHFLPQFSSIGFFILALPVVIAIAGGLWLTAAAAYENVKFVHTTDQLLSLIGIARSDAATDAEFGQRTNEDIIDDMVRRAQFRPQPTNSWGGGLRATIQPLPYMRIETDVPVRACRRLAQFFGKDASAFRLLKLEAYAEGGNWQTIFDATTMRNFDYRLINTACGRGTTATFAITLQFR